MATVQVSIEVGNARGAGKEFTLTIPEEDLEGLEGEAREEEIDAFVAGEVLEKHVYWSWREADG